MPVHVVVVIAAATTTAAAAVGSAVAGEMRRLMCGRVCGSGDT